ncbi:hypothetical protein ABI_10170 [Asticcacaulis biprosthecium C19]|uniref:Inner membrane protein yhaI n=1 Tax=Asticcacaulis biprosthecium C19 TaxID=715226 RepID=F4QH43_9CAUL|nr:DUF805 domain-containing protein [Asticcacaulis biprosthecium]EGF92580.1 hypothetical protein ABI_10170 [Asticcacaulis biprosthecium C19]
MGFGEAVKSCFKNYVNFEGRASRSEFWFFRLFMFLTIIGAIVLAAIAAAIGGDSAQSVPGVTGLLMGVFFLGILLPDISVSVRRLHDTNKSGFWLLISFIPFGGIVLLVFFCTGSDSGPNRFGPNPYARNTIAKTFE